MAFANCHSLNCHNNSQPEVRLFYLFMNGHVSIHIVDDHTSNTFILQCTVVIRISYAISFYLCSNMGF